MILKFEIIKDYILGNKNFNHLANFNERSFV